MSFNAERGNESDPHEAPDEEISLQELGSHGVEVEHDESLPGDEMRQDHPTPNHPTGRLGP